MAALVLGVLGFISSWFVLGSLPAIVGLVLGIVALARIGKTQQTGKGMAIAGTVLSAVALVIAGVVFAVLVNKVGPELSQLTRCLHRSTTAEERQACRDQFGQNFLSPTP